MTEDSRPQAGLLAFGSSYFPGLPGFRQWLECGVSSPITAAALRRILTGFPFHRRSADAKRRHLWLSGVRYGPDRTKSIAADLDADRDGLVVTPIAGFKNPDDAVDVL